MKARLQLLHYYRENAYQDSDKEQDAEDKSCLP